MTAPGLRVTTVTRVAGVGWMTEIEATPVGARSVVRSLALMPSRTCVVVGDRVEMTTFGLDALIKEVLRQVPGAGPLAGEALEPVTLPGVTAVALLRGLADGDERLLAGALRSAGLPGVPPVIESLTSLSADVAMTLSSRGRATRLLRLVKGEGPWLNLALAGDRLDVGLTVEQFDPQWLRRQLRLHLAAGLAAGLEAA